MHAVKCNVSELRAELIDHQGLTIISTDYNYISVGMNVSLSCSANGPSGLVVPTSPVLTCTKDGQWTPELSKIMCVKGMAANNNNSKLVANYIQHSFNDLHMVHVISTEFAMNITGMLS